MLFIFSGDHWRIHRDQLKSNFALPIINSYLEVFNSQSRALLSNVECYVGKGQFDPSSFLKKIAFRTSFCEYVRQLSTVDDQLWQQIEIIIIVSARHEKLNVVDACQRTAGQQRHIRKK